MRCPRNDCPIDQHGDYCGTCGGTGEVPDPDEEAEARDFDEDEICWLPWDFGEEDQP